MITVVSLCAFSFFPAVEFFVVVELYGGVSCPEVGVDVRRNARQWPASRVLSCRDTMSRYKLESSGALFSFRHLLSLPLIPVLFFLALL